MRVKLKNGIEFVDQFIERTKSKRVIFKSHKVNQGEIRSFVPWGSNSPNAGRQKKI